MTTSYQGPAIRPAGMVRLASIYDHVADGLVRGIYFRLLVFLAPIQSVLLTPVQGSTPAFLLTLASAAILIVSPDRQYTRILGFYAGFVLIYAIYMALSLSGYTIDQPDMSRLTVIREVYIYGQLKQTHITQGLYLFTALLFTFLVYTYYQESFLRYAFYGIIFLSLYGFYEFVFFAIFQTNGDFLSNRNFGELGVAAAGAGQGDFATGSQLQTSNLFGAGFMRLKSLTGEPSMYALSVTPFAVYAFGRRWWSIFVVLAASLVLSTSTTGVIGLAIGLVYIQVRRRPEAILYVVAAAITLALLYATADPVRAAFDKLLFNKLDTVSGNTRLQSFFDHAGVPFDGNPVRLLFGLGFGTVRATDMMSNLLANIGVIGLLCYAIAVLTPCILLREAEDRVALIATLLAIFAMEMLTVSEYAYLPPWFMIALAYARVREQRRGRVAPAMRQRQAGDLARSWRG